MEKNKTIKQFKVDSSWDNREKALIFYHSEEFKKRFSDLIYKRFRFPIYFLQDIDLLIEELNLIQYSVIFLDVNSIIDKLSEILSHVRSKKSRNRATLIYLITSDVEIASELKEIKTHKKIIHLFKGKDIVYLPGGKKYPQ